MKRIIKEAIARTMALFLTMYLLFRYGQEGAEEKIGEMIIRTRREMFRLKYTGGVTPDKR